MNPKLKASSSSFVICLKTWIQSIKYYSSSVHVKVQLFDKVDHMKNFGFDKIRYLPWIGIFLLSLKTKNSHKNLEEEVIEPKKKRHQNEEPYTNAVDIFWDDRESIVTQLGNPMLIKQDIVCLHPVVEETRNNSGMQELHSLCNSN